MSSLEKEFIEAVINGSVGTFAESQGWEDVRVKGRGNDFGEYYRKIAKRVKKEAAKTPDEDGKGRTMKYEVRQSAPPEPKETVCPVWLEQHGDGVRLCIRNGNGSVMIILSMMPGEPACRPWFAARGLPIPQTSGGKLRVVGEAE